MATLISKLADCRQRLFTGFVVVVAITLTACSSVSVDDYADNTPVFDPQIFFNGDLVAEGIIQNRSGKVTRYFTADIEAYWDDEYGYLDEVFWFSDGEEEYRLWEFERIEDGVWEGRAGDVEGVASLEYAGNAIEMDYRLRVTLDSGREVTLRMEDWLYLVDDDILIAETTMRWFGFRVGNIILTMRRI
ncbi:MAG: DUF3833 domain-containing protein [Natronospirillum sp.]|uniref:DUF3833 family protein n=1 Tax=Natronospirillum sp. TaxID=2812955 RepID=UPI0025F6BB05|nr:DUF3833 family protein [Natronospirillum sp.]MCH8552154.1 DUF3833 domain-containing protein [Natronospirillum sp.]